jgi:hypothetical protein
MAFKGFDVGVARWGSSKTITSVGAPKIKKKQRAIAPI